MVLPSSGRGSAVREVGGWLDLFPTRIPTSPPTARWTRSLIAAVIGLAGMGRGSFGGMDLMSLIETRPGVRSGKPCFVGTRIAVYDVLDYLASGMRSAEIVDEFPELSDDHVRAAIGFAAMRERRLATPA